MAKLPSITTITTANNNISTLNSNFNALRNAFTNFLSRDGETPNTMTADLDMNSQNILNAATVRTDSLFLGGVLVANLAYIPTWADVWQTSTAYTAYELVRNGTSYYVCLVDHTSGTFSTDLAADKWVEYFESNYDPSAVAITGGTIDGTVIGGTTPAAGTFTDIVVDDATPTVTFSDSAATGTVVMEQVTGTFELRVDPGDVDASSAFQMDIDGTAVMTVSAGGSMAVGDDPGTATVTFEVDGTDAMLIPVGSVAQRPTGADGYVRYNSDDDTFEWYGNSAWHTVAEAGDTISLPTAVTSSGSVTNAQLAGNVWQEVDTDSGDVTLTVPAGLTGDQPVTFENTGTSSLIFAAGTGVTINSKDSNLTVADTYSAAVLVPKGSNVYSLIGDLSA